MKITITQDGNYADYSSPPKVTTRGLKGGDVISVTDEYGNYLIQSGLAIPYQAENPTDEPVEKKPTVRRKRKQDEGGDS